MASDGPALELAKRALRFAFGPGIISDLDPGGGRHPRLPDLQVLSAEGITARVEVTRLADEELLAARARADTIEDLSCPELDRNWIVYSGRNVKVKRVHRNVARLLAELTKEGRDRFYGPYEYTESPSVRSLWGDLGLDAGFATSFPKDSPATVEVVRPGTGGAITSESLVEAAEGAAAAKASKDWASSPERHVFVVVPDEAAYTVWRALTDGYVPPRAPELPPEVTAVWLTAEHYDRSLVLWGFDISQNHWRIFAFRAHI